VAKRIAELLRPPFNLWTEEVSVSASIGVSLRSTEKSEQLLRNADIAMCRAKEDAKARYAVCWRRDLMTMDRQGMASMSVCPMCVTGETER
jgi:predicted signal transduction protein with EAL and GGDEF domain